MTKKTNYFSRIMRSVGLALIVLLSLWGFSVATKDNASSSVAASSSNSSIKELVASLNEDDKKALFVASDNIYQLMLDVPEKRNFKVTDKTLFEDFLYRLKMSEIYLFLASLERLHQSPFGPQIKALMEEKDLSFKVFGLYLEELRKAVHPAKQVLTEQ